MRQRRKETQITKAFSSPKKERCIEFKNIRYAAVRSERNLTSYNFGNALFLLTVLCMARCGKSAMIFRRNRKIANCKELRLGIQPQ